MHVVIIGNGISGITTARFVRKLSNHRITVISSESDYFFSRTALMYIYMGHMREKDTQPYEDWFWKKNRIELVNTHVEEVDFENKKLNCRGGKNIGYDKLVISVGSKSKKFGWPGQDLNKVQGLYNLQDLRSMEQYSEGLERAVIIGGGLIGIEMAEMFHSRHIPVTFLVREESFWDIVFPQEESQMINREIEEKGIDLRLETELDKIVDDGSGNACAVITNKGEKISCGFVGLTAGVSPNIDFLRDSELELGKGILVNEYLETNLEDVYAIGDCAQMNNTLPGRRPIEPLWYTGKMMGETLAYNLCGKRISYDPGIWFNSAKFFDIEYQVYGSVPNVLPEHWNQIYWEHSDGKKGIRILWDENETIKGFNLMGIRFRHEVCEKWLRESSPVKEVFSNLSLANFDPEFYKRFEHEIVALYQKTTGEKLSTSSNPSYSSVHKFLKAKAVNG